MSESSEFKDIIEYYDHTRSDYKISWDNSPTPAVHFGYYDSKATKHSDALMNTNRVLSDLVDVKEGEKVLDAGCGRGGTSFWLALNRKAICTGITPVQSQIDDCNKQRAVLGLEKNVNFILADYCNTGFEDNSFDVVWACESLCHAPNKMDFYKEAYRILKPNGRLVVAEYLRSSRSFNENQEKLLMSWLNKWAIKDIDSKCEHSGYMKDVGFKDFNIKDVTKNFKTSLKNLHRNASNWLLFGRFLNVVGIRSNTQHNNQVASIKQFEALEQNLWFYAFITAVK